MIKKTLQIFSQIATPVYLFNMLLCIPLVVGSFFLSTQMRLVANTVYNCCAMLLIQIISIKATSHLYNDETFSWEGVLRFSLKKYKIIFLYALLYYFVSLVSALCLLIPAIIISLMAFFVIPVILLEERSIFDAWKRSREMAKGYKWRLLGYFVGIMLTVFIFYSFLGALTSFDEGPIHHQHLLVQILFRLVGYPIDCFATAGLSIFSTIVYFRRLQAHAIIKSPAT